MTDDAAVTGTALLALADTIRVSTAALSQVTVVADDSGVLHSIEPDVAWVLQTTLVGIAEAVLAVHARLAGAHPPGPPEDQLSERRARQRGRPR